MTAQHSSMAQSLLDSIYESPSSPMLAAAEALAQNSSQNGTALDSDTFRMFVYKVLPCTRRGPHSWVECSYSHQGEKAARRCPREHHYIPIACQDMKKDSECQHGDDCVFAHSVFEIWLHPARYRTQLCSYGVDCKRGICFFAHHPGELRVHDNTADLLALEKDLEGSDASSSTATGPFGNNPTLAGNRFGGNHVKTPPPRSGQKNALGGSLSGSRGSPLPVSQSLPLNTESILQAVHWSSLMSQQQPSLSSSSQQQQQNLFNATMMAEQTQQAQYQAQAAILAMSQSMNSNLIRSPPSVPGPAGPSFSSPTAAALSSILTPSPKASRSSASPMAPNTKSNDVKQAVDLVSQLQELVGRTQGSEVASVLLALLPDLLTQVQAKTVNGHQAANIQNQMSQQLHFSPSNPIPLHPSSNINLGAWSSGSPSFPHIDASRFSPIKNPPDRFIQHAEESNMSSFEAMKQSFNYGTLQASTSGLGFSSSPLIGPSSLGFVNPQHQYQRSSPADVLSLKSKRSEQTSCSSRSQSPTQSEHYCDNESSAAKKQPTFLPMGAAELESPFCTPMLHPELHRAIEQEKGLQSAGPVFSGAKRANDESLAAAMSDMSGASAMIASLSLLVDPFDNMPS